MLLFDWLITMRRLCTGQTPRRNRRRPHRKRGRPSPQWWAAEVLEDRTLLSGVTGIDAGDRIDQATETGLGTAAGSFVCDESIDNDGTGIADVDLFRIEAAAGETLVARTESQPSSDNIVNTLLRLFDSGGNQIAFDDDSGPGLYSELEHTFDTDGVYFVGVTAFPELFYDPAGNASDGTVLFNDGTEPFDGEEGDYRLTLSFDTGDTQAAARETGIGAAGGAFAFTERIGNGPFGNRDVDLYRLEATAGQFLTTETFGPNGSSLGVDTVLRIFDDNGSEIAINNDRPSLTGDVSSRIDFQFDTSGTFFVGVSGNPNTVYDSQTTAGSVDGDSGDYGLRIDVGNVTADGEIQGTRFNDRNANGVRDPGEEGLDGLAVFVDLNGNGVFDDTGPAAEPFAVTDIDGNYAMTGLLPGVFRVADVVPADFARTAPGVVEVNLFEADFTDGFGDPSADGFTSTGSQDEWHLSTGRGSDSGHTAGASFYFGSGENNSGGGQYDNNADGTLTSPLIDLTGLAGQDIFLDFNHFLEIEDVFDTASVEIVSGNVRTVIADNNSVGGLPDSTAGFEAVSLDISAFAGSQIQVEFTFESDGSVRREGWYIDDVVVRTTVGSGGIQFVTINASDIADGVNFGERFLDPAEISGTVFSDANGDGIQDVGELGFMDVTVFLDLNGNGQLDKDAGFEIEPFAVTDSNGNYSLTGLIPRTYTVVEILQPGFSSTLPAGGAQSISVVVGETRNDVDFGNTTATEISGTKFSDLDGDGMRDPGEPGVEDVTIFLDANGNGILDVGGAPQAETFNSPNVPVAIRDVTTVFSQLNVNGLSGAITDVNLTLDITHTFDADLRVFLNAPSGTRVQLFSGVGGGGNNFTNTTLDDQAAQPIGAGSAPFTGTFRPDGLLAALDGEDPNGVWQLEIRDAFGGDTGTLNSWSLTILTDQGPPDERFTLTDADGNYSFTDVVPGTQTVREVLPTGFNQTFPGFAPLELFRADFSDNSGGPSDDGFTSAGFNDEWHVSTERGNDAGHSANASYYFGNEFAFFGPEYSSNADGTLTSPTIDLTAFASEQLFLDFNHFLDVEGSPFDIVDVSVFAGGVTTLIADNDAIGNLPDFSGDFQAVTLDISSFAGQQIQVQFSLTSDSSVEEEGWYIDDVVVRTGPQTGAHRVTIAAGESINGLDFGNQSPGEIRGTKFNDLNGNGARDVGEPGVEGVIIFLDGNNNGLFDAANEQFTVTDADGNYAFTGLTPGTFVVRESALSGFEGTNDPTLVITEIGPDSPDFFEIQNVAGTTIDTTGWQVFVSGTAAASRSNPDINSVNTGPFDLQSSFAPGEVIFSTDSSSRNFFGSNIFWIDGRTGWAMIVDDAGEIVDWVGWGWTEAQIASFSVDTGATQNVTLAGFWNGPGAVAGGRGTLQRTGSTDSDNASDFGYAPASQGVQNTGLDLLADFVQTFPVSPADRIFIVPRDSSNQIAEIDPVTGAELNRFFAPEPTSSSPGLAFDGVSLFFMERDSAGTNHELFELDPDTGAVIDNDPVAAPGGRFDGLAALNGLIYLSDFSNDDILVFDPVSDTVIETLDINGLNSGVNLAGGISGIHNPDRILALENFGENVIEIDPATGLVTRSFAAAAVYTGLTVVNDNIFLGDFFGTPGIDVFSRDGRFLRSITLPFGIGAAGGDDGLSFTAQDVTVAAGQIVTGIDFGNRIPPGEIRGTKFNDLNQDGRQDPGEPALAGVTIFLDTNGNGLLDGDEISTTTDANGEYQLTGLQADTYFVTEVLTAGFQQTFPQNDPRLVITEVDLNTPDFFEIQNVSTAAIDTTGWRAFVSSSSININAINPTFFNLPASVAAGEIIFSTDSVSENFFGANINWANTEEAWVMIVDDAGQIVDWVGWGWTEDEIEIFSVDVGGLENATLAGIWVGPSAAATGPKGATLQRFGVTDSNSAVDFAFAPITKGSQNNGLTIPFIDRPTVHIVTLGVGQIAQDIDFGNVDPNAGVVQGTKFSDLDGDGERDPGEPGLAGFTIFFDADSNGQLDAGEIFTVTDADGDYTLHGVSSGTVDIVEVLQFGFVQTFPLSGVQTIALAPGQLFQGVDFGNQPLPGEIVGTKFFDANQNGILDPGEPGIEGTLIFVDANANGTLDAGEQFTTTDTDGNFVLDGLTPNANHIIAEIPPPGFIQTAPNVTGLYGIEFGNTLFDVNPANGASTNPVDTELIRAAGIAFDANGVLYGLEVSGAFDGLSRIDRTTGATDVIGLLGLPFNTVEGDIAFDPGTGVLFGLYGGGRSLFTIDVTTGRATIVGDITGSGDPSAMAFDSLGNLFVLDTANEDLLLVDQQTGGILSTTPLSQSLGSVAGMAFHPLTGELYVADGNTNGTDSLFTLDTGTGQLTEVGPTGLSSGLAGLAFLPPQLFGTHTIFVGPDGAIDGVNFGNIGTAQVQGTKFFDTNLNGDRDLGEPGIEGVTIFFDFNDNGLLDVGEVSTITDADGNYTLTGLPAGAVTIAEVVPTGFVQTFPNGNGTHELVLGPGEIRESIDFGNVGALIEGTKFSDANSNGLFDDGEVGLPGFTIQLRDANFNVIAETLTLDDDPDTPENEAGTFQFFAPAGTLFVTEIQQDGFVQTAPVSAANTLVEFNFENGAAGFTFDGQWNLSNGRAQDAGHSSSSSFYFGSGENVQGGGTYANNAAGSLISPVITLPADEQVFLQFNHFLEIEDFFDTASVAVISGGVRTVLADNNLPDSLPNSTGTFQPVSLDLSQFAGNEIQIEFRFESDFSVVFEGWYVDDVAVRLGVPSGVFEIALGVGGVASGINFGNRDLDEFGNSIADATPVPLIANQTVRISSRIDRAGDVDVFQFVAAQDGFLAIRLEASDGSVNPFLRLFDDAGVLLAIDDNGGSFLDSFLAVPVTTGQSFFLEASSTDDIGAYELELISTEIQAAIALSPIGPDQFLGTAAGEIVSPGQVRVFDLTIPNGVLNDSELIIDLARTANSNLDTILLLIDPQTGEVIDFNDDFIGLDSQIRRNVDAGDQFFVVATGFGESVGRFTLAVQTVPPVVDDFSNDPANPFDLGLVDVTQNGVIGTAGDVDAFLIEIPPGPGGLLTIDLTRDVAAGSTIDTVLELRTADGQTIIEVNDDTSFPTFSLNSQIERQVSAGEQFVLVARGFSTSQGAYRLNVRLNNSVDAVGNVISPAATLIPLPDNGSFTQPGTIVAAGDVDVFRVTIPANFPPNTALRIRQNAVGGGLDPFIRVFDENGNQIAFNDDVGFDPATFQFSFNSSTSVNVLANTVIFVQAGAFGSSSGGYDLIFDVADDFSDNVSDAVPVLLDSNGAGNQAGAVQAIGDVDVFRVAATANGLLTFELTGDPGVDQAARLENPFLSIVQEFEDGKFREVAVNDDSNGLLDSRISIVAQAGDVFFVRASAFGFTRADNGQANIGNYSLNVTTIATNGDLGATFADATLVFDPNAQNLGLPAGSFVIDSGDTDTVRFIARDTATVTVNLAVPVASTLNARLSAFERVIDPTDSNPAAPTQFIFERIASVLEGGVASRTITFDVTAGNEYVIQVAGNDGTSGAYSLEVRSIVNERANVSTAIADDIGQAVLNQVRQALLSPNLLNFTSDEIAEELVDQAVSTFIAIFGIDPTTSFLVLVTDPLDLTLSDSSNRRTGFVAGRGQVNEAGNGFFSGDGVVELLILPSEDLRFNLDLFGLAGDFRFDARLITPGGPLGGFSPVISRVSGGEFVGRSGSVLRGNLELVLDFSPIVVGGPNGPLTGPTQPQQPPVLALFNGLAISTAGFNDSPLGTSALAFSSEAASEFARLIRSFNQFDAENESPQFSITEQFYAFLAKLINDGATQGLSHFGTAMERFDFDAIVDYLAGRIEEGSASAMKVRQLLFDWVWSEFDGDILNRLWNLDEQPQENPQDNDPDPDQNDNGSASRWKHRLDEAIAALTGEYEEAATTVEAKLAQLTQSNVLQPVPVFEAPRRTGDSESHAAKKTAALAD